MENCCSSAQGRKTAAQAGRWRKKKNVNRGNMTLKTTLAAPLTAPLCVDVG